MVRCNKCQIEKELDQYASYFHSTQNKIRTRRICKSCFNEQKLIYRESIKNKKIIEPVPVSVNPTPTPTPTPEPFIETKVFIDMDIDTKVCFTCKIDKPVTDFYFHRKNNKPFTSCKQCELEKDKGKYQEYIEENGGSDKVRLKPGQWTDKWQQENVEGFLKVIGWKYNGTHWYKEGVRSGEDGIWEKMRGRIKYRKPPNVDREQNASERLRTKIEDIIKLRDAGETLKTICSIYNTSAPTLYKVIKEYYEKN